MRIFTTFIFLVFLTICFLRVSSGAEYISVPEVEFENSTDDASQSITENSIIENEELKSVEVELEAILNQDILSLETSSAETIYDEDEESEYIDSEMAVFLVKDPIQSYNRAIFAFNDKAYYYALKPVSTGYKKVLPEAARSSARRFFLNIKMPVRLVNCLLQAKFKGAGTETLRFLINTTMGVGGFFDPAKSKFQLESQDVDFGQTLAKYKIGDGFYIKWPLIGPSTVRDTVGYVGDMALNPVTLLSFFAGPGISFVTNSYDTINETSLDKGDTYEVITKNAIDPYIALQDAYIQNRIKKIRE